MKQRLVDFIIDRARLWVEILEVEDWAGEEGNFSDSDGSESSDSGDVFSDSDFDLDMAAETLAEPTELSTADFPTTPEPTATAAAEPVRRRSTRIAARWRRRSCRIARKD
jgi:hypothetical protein